MMVGPILLALMAFLVVKTGNGWLTGADAGFLGILAAIMLARWLEFQGGHPQTADGEPATRTHLRRFLLGGTAIGLSVWMIANILGNYVLAS